MRLQRYTRLCILALLFCISMRGHAQKPFRATSDHPGPAWFVDVAAQAGLTALNVNGGTTSKQYVIESTGSGVAILDYDRDGWPDIYLANGRSLPRPDELSHDPEPFGHLYRNNHNGTFSDVTEKAGLRFTGWAQGVCVGDYDNDGFDDLYVAGYSGNRLFHNDGNGHFTDVTVSAGAGGSAKEWSTGCAFVDYDRDGRLDLAVATYVHFDLAHTPKPGTEAGCMWKGIAVPCGQRGLPSAPNMLLHNIGGGRFTDVSQSSGIARTPGHYCFSVTPLDYDEDGWPDLFIACDSTPSILYRNNHDGTFTDKAGEAGVAFNEDGREQAGMGSTAGDYDGDGHLDLFKTNFSDDTATLYRANGDGTFTERTDSAGLARHQEALGWGTMFADMDNDGWDDLLVVNGHVYPEADAEHLGTAYREPSFFYRNDGEGHFLDLSATAGPGLLEQRTGRGLAVADLWNDGRLEAVVNNLSDTPSLLVNLSLNRNHWLEVQLSGTRSNRDALGARVEIAGTEDGRERLWVREVRSGSSYNSSSDLRLHFGLGDAPKLRSVLVRWPSGERESFPVPPLDGLAKYTEGKGQSAGTHASGNEQPGSTGKNSEETAPKHHG